MFTPELELTPIFTPELEVKRSNEQRLHRMILCGLVTTEKPFALTENIISMLFTNENEFPMRRPLCFFWLSSDL